MSLFGSRRRRPPNTVPSTTLTAPHADAATAALSAFSLRDNRSNPSLSEAAAAAALKARPHTPTDVSSVVPRRYSRRAGSAHSSHGSASPHSSTRRSPSSGSMGDRTFRSPSPHGREPLTGDGTTHSSAGYDDAPPVPSIPAGVQAPAQPPVQRAGSLRIATTPIRLASQKLKDKNQATWFGAPAVGDLGNVRTADDALASAAALPPQDPVTRTESRSSVNFSYPARHRLGSPPASPVTEEAPPVAPSRPRTADPHVDRPGPVRAARNKTSSTAVPPSQQRRGSAKSRPVSMSDAQDLVYDPNSRRMVPRAELLALEQILSSPEPEPQMPPKRKRSTRAGTHLARGTVARSQGSAVPGSSVEPIASAARRTAVEPAKNYDPRLMPESRAVGSVQPQPTGSDHIGTTREENDHDDKTVSRHHVPPHAQHQSTSPPSNVAAEEAQSYSPPQHNASQKDPSSTPVTLPPVQHQSDVGTVVAGPAHPMPTTNALDSVKSRQHINAMPEPKRPVVEAAELPHELSAEPISSHVEPQKVQDAATAAPMGVTTDFAKSERAQSLSPVRVAHFGPVQRNLSVRHSPPPRSISPRKSALKQHSPPRSGSSADDASEAGAAQARDTVPVSRKKSVRVSFDDREIVLDDNTLSDASQEAEKDPAANSSSTSNRRKWFSNIGRSKNRDTSSLDDYEVMKPRPALPSFGSVREKKKPHAEVERPLVRPSGPTYSPPIPDSPSLQSLPSTVTSERVLVGQSSDHAIGSILASDQASRVPANTSRFREPLPPVVTSRESGYLSTSSDDSSDAELELRDTPALSTQPSVATTVLDMDAEEDTAAKVAAPGTGIAKDSRPAAAKPKSTSQAALHVTAAQVPSISVTSASPQSTHEATPTEKLIVPGSFPDEDSEDAMQSRPINGAGAAPKAQERESSLIQGPKEPEKAVTAAPSTAVAAALATQTAGSMESDSEGSSIYSDAYEDLSDMDEAGFQSIDAVIESPMPKDGIKDTVPGLTATKVPEATTSAQASSPPPAPAPALALAPSPPVDDWEAAKAYWRTLTAEKRAQLESEAAEEAGAEADLEQEAKDERAKIPRRKKSVEKRQAEKQAILAAQADPSRVYMIKPGTRVPDEPIAQSHSVLRSSMRHREDQGQAAEFDSRQGRLRKSMRTTSVITQPASSQHTRPRTANKAQAMSLATTQAAAGAAHRVHNQAGTASPAASSTTATSPPVRSGTMSSFFPPVLKRRGSTSSESSFRRTTTRRATMGGAGGFSLRKTMRSPPADQAESATTNKRFSLRSFSPSDLGRAHGVASPPPVSLNSQRMRTSLRDGGKKTRGVNTESGSGGGMHLPSFGLRNKARGRSRFDDSSDEEDADRSGFRSRFEDSSDDEEVATSAPQPAMGVFAAKTMRGGRLAASGATSKPEPVREESPDLPDSSDDDEVTIRGDSVATVSRKTSGTAVPSAHHQPSPLTGPQLRRTRSGRGTIGGVAPPSLGTSLMKGSVAARPGPDPHAAVAAARPSSRRGSFISAVLGRRRTAPAIQRGGEIMDSAARRDTALERSASELVAVRAASPRLQKRQASLSLSTTLSGGEDWPLATSVVHEKGAAAAAAAAGPSGASAGLMTSSRPAPRRSMSHGDVVVGEVDGRLVVVHSDATDEVVPAVVGEALPSVTGPKKKKKFGALRRMFKLDD